MTMRTGGAGRAALMLLACAAIAGRVEPLGEAFDYDLKRPAAGSWLGDLTTPAGSSGVARLTVSPAADGSWSIAATVAPIGAFDVEADDVVIDGRRIEFTIDGTRFAGIVSDDGQRLAGEVEGHRVLALARTPRPGDLAEPLAFAGGIELPSRGTAALAIVLAETPGGRWVGELDFPAGGLRGFPLVNIEEADGVITAHLLGRRPAVIRASLDLDRSRLRGTFSQGPLEIDVDLRRGGRAAGARAVPRSSWMLRRHLEEPWAMVGATVVDVRGGRTAPGATVVIRGDVIESVSQEPPAAGVRTVDVTGRWMIPGLFDLHAHIQPFGSGAAADTAQAAAIMRALIDHGVTTVRALPLMSEFATSAAARVNDGTLLGPTVIPAGGVLERDPQRTSFGFGDPQTARRWVERDALLGARWIKVYNSMDEASLEAIVAAAHARGLKVCGHTEGVPPREASRIGIDSIEHIVSIPISCLRDGAAEPPAATLGELAAWRWANADARRCAELMDLLLADGTAWVPTLVVVEQMIAAGGHDGARGMDPGTASGLRDAMAAGARLAVGLHRDGGLVGLGTDFPIDGVKPGDSVHREMELLVALGGATPREALEIATAGSARVLGIDGIAGAVEPGYVADLVVLRADPLASISATREIELVVHDGRLHRP